jgi:hypothetical protein
MLDDLLEDNIDSGAALLAMAMCMRQVFPANRASRYFRNGNENISFYFNGMEVYRWALANSPIVCFCSVHLTISSNAERSHGPRGP